MCDDDWVRPLLAMADDSKVVDLLLPLHRPPWPPAPSIHLCWTMCQRRSRSVPSPRHTIDVAGVHNHNKPETTRASPTTLLSWSGATSASGGYEESSTPTKHAQTTRSKSRKVYIQMCNTLGSPPIPEQKLHVKPAGPKLQDLNFLSSPSKVPLNLFDETSLDLKLVSSSLPSSNYQSTMCTLDKVKSALERAEKEPIRKRASFLKSSLSASSPSSI